MVAETRLMPGVGETIPELARRGFKLAVCSNKRIEFTRELVRALGLGDYFTCVLGPEDVGTRAKPDPAMLLEGLSRLGVSARSRLRRRHGRRCANRAGGGRRGVVRTNGNHRRR